MKEAQVLVSVYFDDDQPDVAVEAAEVVAHLLQADIPYVTTVKVNSFLVETLDGRIARSVL